MTQKNNIKIAFITVYFGKLPNYIDLWLYTCSKNPSIDWFLFTDDVTKHKYPKNVHVYHNSFNEFKDNLQELFDFKIELNNIRKICDYKVVYGHLFEDILKDYNFWGYCDLDMIWGDIRTFLTNDILNSYEKIGFIGSFTLFKNSYENNRRYREINSYGTLLYKDYFTSDNHYCFDEIGINDIFLTQELKIYNKVSFSTLASNNYNFIMRFMPRKDKYKNKNVIYIWDNGKLYHAYIYKNKVRKEEVMSLHFLSSRNLDITFKNRPNNFLIIPNKFIKYNNPSLEFIKENTKPHYIKYIKENLKKRKSIIRKMGWLYLYINYNLNVIFNNHIFNYWTWDRKYNKHRKKRMYILK